MKLSVTIYLPSSWTPSISSSSGTQMGHNGSNTNQNSWNGEVDNNTTANMAQLQPTITASSSEISMIYEGNSYVRSEGHSIRTPKNSRPETSSVMPIRKIRIITNDPYATDSSDDEEGYSVLNPKRVVIEVVLPSGDSVRAYKTAESVGSCQYSNNEVKRSLSKKNTTKKDVVKSLSPNQSNPSTN